MLDTTRSTYMGTPITIAFAGPADIEPQNVKDLLNDYVGLGAEDADGYPLPTDREVTLIFPVTEDHLSEGLHTVLDWSEYADIPFTAVTDGASSRKVNAVLKEAEETVKAANVNDAVVRLLKDAEGEAVLVLLFGEEGDENAEVLLDLALAADIPVKDLTAGLDDLSFGEGDEEEPAAEPEPEPEPEPEVEEKPTRGRRRAKAEPEPLEEAEEELTDEPAAPAEETEAFSKQIGDKIIAAKEEAKAPRGRGRKAPVAEPTEPAIDEAQVVTNADLTSATIVTPAAAFDIDLIEGTLQAVYAHLRAQDEANAAVNLAEVRERPLTLAVKEALEALLLPQEAAPVAQDEEPAEEAEEAAPKRSRGRPRKDGTPAQARTEDDLAVAYIKSEDGTYRKAGRGRPRRGEERVSLTPAQIEDLTEQGLVED